VPVLLTTKLHPPALRRLVPRPELMKRLDEAVQSSRLALVDAPAGWGKTTLLASWANWTTLNTDARRIAWLSLDSTDDDPTRFWSYVLAALDTAVPGVAQEALAWLQAPGRPLIETVVPALLNELARLTTPVVVVIDDYHLVADPAIHDGIAYLVHRLPRTTHLMLVTRYDPPLPRARLRAAGEIAEIRARDLRFDAAEAGSLFNDVLGLDLDVGDVATLLARTEGWAAGLCLAALTLTGDKNRHVLVTAFGGTDRHLIDYVGVEILDTQSPQIREFLLRTSILDRLTAELCDAVTGRTDSASLLERIERHNLFLVPLDERYRWYRYHHLFAELLRHELSKAAPGTVQSLHRRACDWYRKAGLPADAVSHALAAGARDEARELIATWWTDTFNEGRLPTVSRWLDALPPGIVEDDARLCLARAWIAIDHGRLDEVDQWLDLVERNASRSDVEVNDGATLAGHAVVLRAVLRFKNGDIRHAADEARRALMRPGIDPFRQTVAHCVLGITRYWSGDPPGAASELDIAIRHARESDNHLATAYALGYRALVHIAVGALDEGRRLADEAVVLGEDPARRHHFVRMAGYLALGTIRRVEGDPVEAVEILHRAVDLARNGAGRIETAAALLGYARALGERSTIDEARAAFADAETLIRACRDPGTLLRSWHDGVRRLLPSSTRRVVVAAGDELTNAELAVVRLLARGLTVREIAAALTVSPNTVKTHIRAIYRKLGDSSRENVIRRAHERGLL
jgi:LuxR family transcriptional regulator, maltose regulon positive regulatory protein